MTGSARRKFVVGLLVAYACLFLAVSPQARFVSAQDPARPESELQNLSPLLTAPPKSTAEPPRVLVTTDGRLIEGPMVSNGMGYTVQLRAGQMVVPQNVIKFTARSRRDAYRQYQALMPEPTPDNHVSLARWCLQNQLVSDGRQELLKALKLDPQHATARELFVALERQLAADPQHDRRPQAAPRIFPGADAAPETSTAGLSPENVKEFVTVIQPILMNNCAQAGCHHKAADNRLRLEYVRRGGHNTRLATERNLETLLDMIRDDASGGSVLLEKARERHGGAVRSLTLAPKGDLMVERLERWIGTVAGQESAPAEAAVRERGVIQQVSGTAEAPRRRTAASATPTTPTTDAEFVQEILQESRPDRFDPARFNRGRP